MNTLTGKQISPYENDNESHDEILSRAFQNPTVLLKPFEPVPELF